MAKKAPKSNSIHEEGRLVLGAQLPYCWPPLEGAGTDDSGKPRVLLFCGESDDQNRAFHNTLHHLYLTFNICMQIPSNNIYVLYGNGVRIPGTTLPLRGQGTKAALKLKIQELSGPRQPPLLLFLCGHGIQGSDITPTFLKCCGQNKEDDNKHNFGQNACSHLKKATSKRTALRKGVRDVLVDGPRLDIDLSSDELTTYLKDISCKVHVSVHSCFSGGFFSVTSNALVRSFTSATDSRSITGLCLDNNYWQSPLAWSTMLGMSWLSEKSWPHSLYNAHRATCGCSSGKSPLFYLRPE